ncbi:MAG: acyltransferase [Proteobacteria bacterium]|nr:acyltransferase [Pseudomonadota bacterium]
MRLPHQPDEIAHEAPQYRADIDGLRAVAVLSVVIYHAFPNALRGGFVGVDVFFVISGYLISGIILRGVRGGTFSYLDFYIRRIRRIFPALIVVLLACLLYGYRELFASEFARMSVHMAAAAGFVANIAFWHEINYFDIDSTLKPLLHLWSLGVEEQYYIVWPVLVSLVAARGRLLAWLIGLTFAASFAVNLRLTAEHPEAAFFLPFGRFWELMLGSALACAEGRPRGADPTLLDRVQRRWDSPLARNLLAWIGGALIGGAVLLLDNQKPFPGWRALLPTLGATLLIAAGPRAWVNRNLLSLRVAVFFGLISYPLYLWHWPILAFMKIDSGADISRPVRAAAVLAAVALAWATYRFIERPIRFGGHRTAKAGGLAVAMAAIGVVALLGGAGLKPRQPRDDFVAYFDSRYPDFGYTTAHDMMRRVREECNFLDVMTNAPRAATPPECTTPTTSVSVLLWGDSHVGHLAPGLEETLPPWVSRLQIATANCNPGLGDETRPDQPACARSLRFARERIPQVRPDVVVLAQRRGHLATDWEAVAAGLQAMGVRKVILVGPVPQWDRHLNHILARHYWPEPPQRLSYGLIDDVLADDRELKRRYGQSTKLLYLSVIDLMCDAGGCLTYLGQDRLEDIVASDYGHLTPRASRYVADRLLAPAILSALQPKAQASSSGSYQIPGISR